MARLLWRDAQGIEGSLDLASTEIKIGRAMDCAIRTDDAMVSRHHSRVFWGGGGYILDGFPRTLPQATAAATTTGVRTSKTMASGTRSPRCW